MTFNYTGYPLQFIQKRICHDKSAHLFTLIYKFYSPVTKYPYILHADYHVGDVFAIKFYAKPYRHSVYKYSKMTNRGDVGNILMTCFNIIPFLLQEYPAASFGFIASATVDTRSGKVESPFCNQRFKTYQYIVTQKFGTMTFAHYAYKEISAYLLVNRNVADIAEKERTLIRMFSDTYVHLPGYG